MEHLHAYWRIKYIKDKKKNTNKDLFLNLLKDKNDKKSLIFYKSEFSFLVLNKFPYNAGHIMAVPYKKTAFLHNLNSSERIDYINIIIKGQDILQKALNPIGFNIGMNIGINAGAGVPDHIHCHIIPRWQGDTNFMPVINNTRVLPQSLNQMWKHLKKFIY